MNRRPIVFAAALAIAGCSSESESTTNDAIDAASDTSTARVDATLSDVDSGGPDAPPIDAPSAVADASADSGPAAPMTIAYTGSDAVIGANAADGATHAIGREFEITVNDVSILDLGVWDQGADGLAAPHTVTLFSLDKSGAGANATPVVGGSVVVTKGNAGTLDAGFRFAPLPNALSLPKGHYAIVAYGMNKADPYGDGGNIPLTTTGITDSAYDIYDKTGVVSPAFPATGDANNHTSASFHYRSATASFLRIMPLGASITDGSFGTKAGYRSFLGDMLTAHGMAHQFVGSWTDNPGPLSRDETHHEGHPGSVIAAGDSGRDGIMDHIDFWLGPSGVDPDIILLLVGSNDVDIPYKLADAPARMDALIAKIANKTTGLKPNARLFVATLPLIDTPAEETLAKTYNAGITKVALAHAAAGERVSVVDVHSVITPADKANNLHPNDSGYQKIASLWFDAIAKP